MGAPITEPLEHLVAAWGGALRRARRRVGVAVVALAWVIALLVARRGSDRARWAGAVGIVGSAALVGAWQIVGRRRHREAGTLLRGPARRVDPVRVDRVVRALSLVGPGGEARGTDGVSSALARLHVARAVEGLPSASILERAERIASRASTGALVLGICAAGVTVANAWSVLEGADVLGARHGVAPLPMQWLDHADLTARPPDYLRDPAIHEVAMTAMELPFGTQLTVRGQPLHPGRRLLLSDGTTEVPFVDDGAGSVIARWSVGDSTVLHVVARFGDVVIAESDGIALTSIPDLAPVVQVEGAPRQVRLVDATEDIAIKYEASDDHGLREVHLVLRSGSREERRVLARLDGETRSDAGGRVLKLLDPFLKKSHAPVEVTVEAKDNDPLNGPKWGVSAAITVIPPDVGEPEALRLDALRGLRDLLVDTLAWRLESDAPPAASERKAFLADEKTRTEAAEERLEQVVAGTYAGLRVQSRTRALLSGQRTAVRKALEAELRAPTKATHAAVVHATERFVLVVDATVRGLGMHDARESAKQLADSADELASGANAMQNASSESHARGGARMDAATLVLGAGARAIPRLGSLGRDLGEIVLADLLRIDRARSRPDYVHAELAARDLAARLRQPDPSFGSRGGSGRAGGESGGARGTPGDDGQGSDDAEQAFDEAANDLERLSQDHAGGMSKVEQALAGATSDEEASQMRDEVRQHAQAIRDAARQLPAVGMGSDSWTSKGAAARELAEQTARSLEQGRPEDAAQSGRGALGSLDEAKRLLGSIGSFDDPGGDGSHKVDEARRKLETETQWIADELKQARKKAAERAHEALQRGGDEEGQMAERAKELEQKGRDRASLPQQALESIEDAERSARQAADALKRGDADEGVEKQRDAQRHLEAAREQLQGEDDGTGSPPSSGGDGKGVDHDRVAVPGADDHKGPEEFRRRVVRGLGQAGSGSLKDAVQRYAEGLLR